MSVKTKDFTAKARGIVGGIRPRSLGDFLDDDKQNDVRKAGDTESRTDDVRKAGDTESRTDDVRKAGDTESRTDDVRKVKDRKTGREEFRFDTNLTERLRRCAFETRRKKTAIVQEALNLYLKAQGF